MSTNNYAKMKPIENNNRSWPSAQITKSPAWCAVDLRDGNQALPNPMTPEQKLEYFKLLCSIGFKEIEIGFPSASEDDFNFCRKLIEENIIPDDVVISVLVQSRSHLITRTIEALKGVRKCVVHVYIATSDLHTQYVFGLKKTDVIETALAAVKQIKNESDEFLKDSEVGLEFSPEEFTDTDLDFAVELCTKVIETWNPKPSEKVILNLPMTVERRLPNEYADMIEIFMKKNKYPEKSIISLHAHNDMGCAVAATTMALMAGAQRVEGTLLGHGERTGNLDLITMALNLEYLGVKTGLNFSDMPEIVDTVERITSMPVHPRHPYCGELVFTAFSGSHQDAIKKGFVQKEELANAFGGWKIPYLHVDPTALGRKFEKFIRINSQSGKGGIAFVLQHDYKIKMPKWMQIDFAKQVQAYADKMSRELEGSEIKKLFDETYIQTGDKIKLINYWPRPSEISPSDIEGEVLLNINGKEFRAKASGNGPISAFVEAVNSIDGIPSFTLQEYEEETMGQSADATGICFVRIRNENSNKGVIAAGTDSNIIQAAAKAIISGLNKL
ncbi:MAG TPA: 2-isopropylmalate synthase [Spirochaetota bacterium]|nr:2-isopropylmalate synthase [Spirochaetota bacterium]HOR43352.1 2-isopropylmalate synthase [Spirochaetota bacterium]HPK54899.1 2-isopropylmalate synthase [Spirochaetota bacterium]